MKTSPLQLTRRTGNGLLLGKLARIVPAVLRLPDQSPSPPEDGEEHPAAGVIRVILSTDLWSQDKSVHATHSTSKLCNFCGLVDEPRYHLNWTCPAFNTERYSDPRLMALVPDPAILPRSLSVYGWASAMVADPTLYLGTRFLPD